MIWWLPIPVGVLVLLFVVDLVLLTRDVRNELLHRRLTKVPNDNIVRMVNPTPGWRVAETGIFTRDGERLSVIVMARGWLRHELSVTEEPVDKATRNPSSPHERIRGNAASDS